MLDFDFFFVLGGGGLNCDGPHPQGCGYKIPVEWP